MTVTQIVEELKSLGDEKVRERNAKNWPSSNHFGVKLGDLRKIAEKLKTNHELALELWETGNLETMLLSVLIMRPAELTTDQLEHMVSSIPHFESATFSQLADWFNSYVVKQHPEKEQLREKWMNSDNVMLARSGWSLTSERVAKNPEGLGLTLLLDRIEKEMSGAPTQVQWTMNSCLAEIGIAFPEHRARALAIGEALGIFRDYPTPKGCTSPFAPIWITELVKRQG